MTVPPNVGPGDPFGRVHYVHHSESSSSSNKLTDPLIVWTWTVFTCLHNFPPNTSTLYVRCTSSVTSVVDFEGAEAEALLGFEILGG